MRRLPDAELELMMIIWDSEQPVSRVEIEKKMKGDKSVLPSTVLTLLSRLEKRGFIRHEKHGKINYYYSLADKQQYLKEEGKSVLDRMFGNSLANFVAALYDGEEMDEDEIRSLRTFIDNQTEEKNE